MQNIKPPAMWVVQQLLIRNLLEEEKVEEMLEYIAVYATSIESPDEDDKQSKAFKRACNTAGYVLACGKGSRKRTTGNARRVAPEKLKTVIRHPIKKEDK